MRILGKIVYKINHNKKKTNAKAIKENLGGKIKVSSIKNIAP